MKKKLLALVCVMALIAGVHIAPTTEATSAEEYFRVGYAKVDINPYYVDGDPDSGIMPVPLRGNGSAHLRLAYDTKMDDNGDGKVDQNDGLYVTCIAVSDSQDNTVLLITMDSIGDMGHTELARKEICKRISGITSDRIMISGTHAHGGVDLTQLNGSSLLSVGTQGGPTVLDANGEPVLGTFANRCLATWRTRLIDHIADAAELAMENRAVATVKKGQIEASNAAGKVMNSVRHYVCTDGTNGKQKYVRGDNFNPRPTQLGKGSKYVDQVSDVDQTLHVISFSFTNGNQPIVLANWRCHPSLNTGGSLPYTRMVSSDYINAFRYQLEKVGYRAAFFQGAGGNNNPSSNIGTEKEWIVGDALSNLKGNTYGNALAQVALQCLNKNMQPVKSGQIKTMQQKYEASCQVYTKLEIDAAYAAIAAYNAGKWNITTPNTYPYVYHDGEQTFCIASVAHANTIINYRTYNENTKKTLEINALLLGPEIAIVTTPGEAFDRYSLQATVDTANKYNDWDALEQVIDAQYGTPLIFGYANQHIGYIPNALSYDYNLDKADTYAVGCYESHITPLARGEGEIMVSRLKLLLNEMINGTVQYCQHCEKEVCWFSLNKWEGNLEYDHYYLSEDLHVAQRLLKDGKNLCLDLRGNTLTGATRAFYLYAGTTVNIMDTSADMRGEITGTGSVVSGGTIWVDPDSTVNLYGGALNCDTATKKPAHGGAVYIKGTVNVYGGKILGCDTNNNGGAIYLNAEQARLNVFGGTVLGGVAAGVGDCVSVNAGAVCVAGDARVDEIYYVNAPNADTFQVVQTAFCGEVTLNKNEIVADGETVIGALKTQWMQDGMITISDGTKVAQNQQGLLVALTDINQGAAVADQNILSVFDTAQNAIDNVGAGYVILGEDVEELTVTKDITVDLNGRNITKAEAAGGATLTLMDSKTDDYLVDDHIYGIVKNVAGQVVPEENYLPITDARGISYHRYSVKLKTVTLRPSACGIYYKSEFLGDGIIAKQIESFGVALNLSQVPDETNMEPGTYSAFTKDAFGGEYTGTVLVDIMQSDNLPDVNGENAKKPINGCAYIKFTDGSYLFSDTVQVSLQEVTERVSQEYWSKLTDIQKSELTEMYHKFSSVMGNWNIENIKKNPR